MEIWIVTYKNNVVFQSGISIPQVTGIDGICWELVAGIYLP